MGTTAYGLDLGTTNTVVAMAKDNGFEVLTIRPTVHSLIICPECCRDFQIGQNAIYERVARQILVDAGEGTMRTGQEPGEICVKIASSNLLQEKPAHVLGTNEHRRAGTGVFAQFVHR